MSNLANPEILKQTDRYVGKSSRPVKTISKITLLFGIFIINSIVPLVDIPIIGLSVTAPLMLIVALQVILKPPKPWFKHYSLWWLFAASIWGSWLFSEVANVLIGTLNTFDSNAIILLIRSVYWLLVMVLTVYLVSTTVHGTSLANILIWGVFILATMRFGEALFFGRIGAGSSKVLSQNTYGLLFSSFALHPIIRLFESHGRKKLMYGLVTAVIFLAIMVNSSRSNWLAIAVGLLVILLILWQSKRLRLNTLVAIIILLAVAMGLIGLFVTMDPTSPIIERFQTFQNIDEDVSFATRQFLIEKGLAQFKSSPWVGVGLDRGRFVFMDIALPDAISTKTKFLSMTLNEHNSYIPVLAETGLIGSIPFALFLIFLIVKGYKAAVILTSRNEIWGAGIFACFISMSVHLWTITGIRNTAAWVVYGLVGGMIMYAQNTKSRKK